MAVPIQQRLTVTLLSLLHLPPTSSFPGPDHRASLHTNCVLGRIAGLMPKSAISLSSRSYEVVLNYSISRPFCVMMMLMHFVVFVCYTFQWS
ncbi:hypothetical protein AtEden1_Chr4g0285881 [Arabidopsis thaliana]